MANKTKAWLIVAISLVLIGGILFCGVMFSLGWDFTKLSTAQFETNRHEFSTLYKNIVIATDTADVVFVPADDAKITVECHEEDAARHLVTTDGDTLSIRLAEEQKWYQRIGIAFDSPKIIVSLPRALYGNLTVDTNTGDVTIPKDFQFYNMGITGSTGDVTVLSPVGGAIKITLSTGGIYMKDLSTDSISLTTSTGDVELESITCRDALSVTVTTGDAYLKNIRCKRFTSTGDTGELSMERVIADETLCVIRTTGDVELECCDAPEIVIETDTGDVTGSLLSGKRFITQTDTGDVRVPHDLVINGTCQITTSTGDIEIIDFGTVMRPIVN